MKIFQKLSIVVALVFLLASCKNGTTGLLIPKDASIVVTINNSSLSSKLSWKDIRQSSWFQDAYKNEKDSFTRKLLDNPDSSGVDTKSNFAFFMRNQGTGSYMVFEGNLKDPSAFESMVKAKAGSDVKTDGDIKYVYPNAKSVVSWNGKQFMFLADAPRNGNILAKHMQGMNNMNNMGDYGAQSFSSDSLRMFSKDLFALSTSNSIETNDHFKSMIKESGDMHLWVNSEQYNNSMAGGMMSMMKMSELFKGNVVTGSLSFDDGKISMKWNQYYGPEMKAILDKYQYKPVSEDMINRIPSQNVIAVAAGNFPPDLFKEIFKAAGIDGMVNGFMGKFNYSLDDLVSAMKGQMVFALSDLNMNRPDSASTSQMHMSSIPNMKLFLALSVNNKASFDKLLSIAKDNIRDPSVWSKINYQVTNDWFVIGNNQDAVDGFIKGGNNHLPFASTISGHPFGGYLDLQRLLKSFQPKVSDSSGKAMLDASVAMWQDIVATGGDYKNGVATYNMEVNLVNKSTNSLKQLNQYAELMNNSARKRPHPEYNQSDSSSVVMPTNGDLPSSTGR